MKKLPLLLLLAFIIAFTGCKIGEDGVWEEYAEWRKANESWYNEQKVRVDSNGNKFYTEVSPVWDTTQSILIHYFNDRKLTEGNLSPLYTSTVDVKYKGCLYNDEPFDSSYALSASYGDSIYRTQCNKTIQGWTIALENMRVGDSCEVIIPQNLAYGTQDMGIIKPYSALKFQVKLVDIPYYEVKEK